MIAEQVAERDGIGMVVMVACTFLMRVAGIKRHAFVHVGFAIPITRAVARFRRTCPNESITRIKHRDAIHEVTDYAQRGHGLGCRHSWRARDAVERLLVFRQVRESSIQPRPHRVTAKTSAADVNPARGRINFLDAGVSGRALGLCAVAPRRDGDAVCLIGVGRVDPGVSAGVGCEPRISAWVLGVCCCGDE